METDMTQTTNPLQAAAVQTAQATTTGLKSSTTPGLIADVWWRQPMVWLVMAGPALVVVAGFWTLWLAISHPDPVLVASPASIQAPGDAETPAQTARNHAATSRATP